MRKIERKNGLEQRNATSANPDAPQRPAGRVLDAGDVEEVIKLDPNEHFTAIYKGYKKIRGAGAGEMSRLHKFVFPDGTSRGVFGTLQLDGMLERAREGEAVWVCYLGKKDLPGGKSLHTWDVVAGVPYDVLPF